jgi:hypothetical protein
MAEDSTSVSVRQQRLGIPEVRPISDALKVDKTKVRCSLRAARREPHCLGLNLQDEHYIITRLKKSRNEGHCGEEARQVHNSVRAVSGPFMASF